MAVFFGRPIIENSLLKCHMPVTGNREHHRFLVFEGKQFRKLFHAKLE